MGEVTFTRHRYGSTLTGATVTVAEAENAPSIELEHTSLDAIAAHSPDASAVALAIEQAVDLLLWLARRAVRARDRSSGNKRR